MEKFVIPPLQETYSVTDGNEVISVILDGGLSRSRADILNAASTVQVSWNFDREEYRYFRAFFSVISRKTAEPFLIDLYMNAPELTEHEAKFIPGTVSLSGQRGLEFTVSATLEVKPNADDFEYELSLVVIIGVYGDEAPFFLNELEQLLNVQMPGSLV